jgi:hypothetical protein
MHSDSFCAADDARSDMVDATAQVVLGAVNVFTGLMIATLHRWGGLWVWITATALLFTLAVVCTASLEMRRRAAYRRMRELKL